MFKKVFNYLSPIWCGTDNKPSVRRVVALILLSLIAYIIFDRQITNQHIVSVVYALLSSIGFLLGFITFDNLYRLHKK